MASHSEREEFNQRASQILAMLDEKYAANFTYETVPELMEKLNEEDRAALQYSVIDGNHPKELKKLIKSRTIYDPFFWTELENSKLDMESKIEKLTEWEETSLKDEVRISVILRICRLVLSEKKLVDLQDKLKRNFDKYCLQTRQFVHEETLIQKMMLDPKEAAVFIQKAAERITILLKKFPLNYQNETIPELMNKLPAKDRAFLQHSIIDKYTGEDTTKLLECRVMDDPHLSFQLGRSELDLERKIDLIIEHLEMLLKELDRNKAIIRILDIFISEKKLNPVW